MVKTKGFRPPKRTATLTFDEDHDYHGAEITVRLDAPMGLLFELENMAPLEMMQRFGDEVLMAWNLETDDGEPIPATGVGLLTQPPDFGGDLMAAWKDAITGVDGPLGRNSDAGGRSARAR